MGTRDDYVTEDEVLEAARTIKRYASDHGVSMETVLTAALRVEMVQMYGSQKKITDYIESKEN